MLSLILCRLIGGLPSILHFFNLFSQHMSLDINLVCLVVFALSYVCLPLQSLQELCQLVLSSNNFNDHEKSNIFPNCRLRLLTLCCPSQERRGGKAPTQARSVETPASEPGDSSGNNTPKDAPKGEPFNWRNQED